MITYSGRPASYNPNAVPLNQEPSVSLISVKRNYVDHRKRVLNAEAIVDVKGQLPDLEKKNYYYKARAQLQQKKITASNEEILQRLSHIDSHIARENKNRNKHIDEILKNHRNLFLLNKQKQQAKINKQNETLLQRIDNTKSQLNMKKLDKWYRHHENIANKRDKNVTRGHIFPGLGDLLPKKLPPLLPNGDDDIFSPSTQSYASHTASIKSTKTVKESMSPVGFEKTTSLNSKVKHSSPNSSSKLKASVFQNYKILERITMINPVGIIDDDEDNDENDENDEMVFNYTDDDDDDRSESSSEEKDIRIVLTSKPFIIPFDTKNCIVEVCVETFEHDSVYLRAISTTDSSKVYSEISLSIEAVQQIVNNTEFSITDLYLITGNEDIQDLRIQMINLFIKHDTQKVGYLTIDQYQELLTNINLGIPSSEMRHVFNQLDENRDNSLQLEEFIPLAVDLIELFRARHKATEILLDQDIIIDNHIKSSISKSEVKRVTEMCITAFEEIDLNNNGIINTADISKTLLNMDDDLHGLSHDEILFLCKLIPRDRFDMCTYSYQMIFDLMMDIRFNRLKNKLIESHCSELELEILKICKSEEEKLLIFSGSLGSLIPSKNKSKLSKNELIYSGYISIRSLMSIFANSKLVNISRLQISVILAEQSVIDGMVSYYRCVPLILKTIEMLCDPLAIRQRAELIELSNLSSEHLLQLQETKQYDLFRRHLSTLFRCCDVGQDKLLHLVEFELFLDALEFRLEKFESASLFVLATQDKKEVKKASFITFTQFYDCINQHLSSLILEKHIRILIEMIHPMDISSKTNKKMNTGNSRYSLITSDPMKDGMIFHLGLLFKFWDKTKIGFISIIDLQEIFKKLGVIVLQHVMDIIISLSEMNDDLLSYREFLPFCAEFLQTHRACKIATNIRKKKEDSAVSEAKIYINHLRNEIEESSNFIFHAIETYECNQPKPDSRNISKLRETLQKTDCGLSKNEINHLIDRLFVSSGHHIKSNSSAITFETIHNTLYGIKKSSIYHNLLSGGQKNPLRLDLLRRLHMESLRLKQLKEIDELSHYLPIKICSDVIATLPNIQIKISQILAIITWSDSYDPSSQLIDYHKFSSHAADILVQINAIKVNDMMNSDKTSVSDQELFNGLTEADIMIYFQKSFEKIESKKHLVTLQEFSFVLRNIPRLRLTDSDIIPISEYVRSQKEFNYLSPIKDMKESQVLNAIYNWRHLVPTAIIMIRQICTKRYRQRSLIPKGKSNAVGTSLQHIRKGMIHSNAVSRMNSRQASRVNSRRNSRSESSQDFRIGTNICIDIDEAIKDNQGFKNYLNILRDMSNKLIDRIRVKKTDDHGAIITLPIDKDRKNHVNRRRSSIMNSHLNIQEEHGVFVSHITLSIKSIAILPLVSNSIDISNPASSFEFRLKSLMRTLPKLAVLLRIQSLDENLVIMDPGNQSKICVDIISIDTKFRQSKEFNIQFPSIAVLDKDLAKEFSENLIDKMYIEYSNIQRVNDIDIIDFSSCELHIHI